MLPVDGGTASTQEDAEVVRGPLWSLEAAVGAGVVAPHIQQRHQQLPVLIRHSESYKLQAIGTLYLKQEDIIPTISVTRIKLYNCSNREI